MKMEQKTNSKGLAARILGEQPTTLQKKLCVVYASNVVVVANRLLCVHILLGCTNPILD